MTELVRNTKETQIKCKVDLDKNFETNIDTKIGFFNHMLEALAKHGNFSIELLCDGDLHVDAHHSVEDCGIVLGQALKKEIFPIENVERYSNVSVVMDEACCTCVLDLSNRPFLYANLNLIGKVGDFDTELVEEFFRAFVFNAGLTVHINLDRGKNKHHIIEAAFKSLAVAIRRALVKNEDLGIPSTKGIL